MATVFKITRWIDEQGRKVQAPKPGEAMPGVRRRTSRCWYFRLAGETKQRVGYTDKAATVARANELEKAKVRGELGLVDRYAESKKTPLATHFEAYTADLSAKGCDSEHVYIVRKRLAKLADACGWMFYTDITPSSFTNWRARNASTMAAKTSNEYLACIRAFIAWAIRHDRMATDTLAHIGKVEQRGNEKRIRRALSDAEITRLLAVAGEYRTVYLAAITTGLRKGELAKLCWGDVHLDAAKPFITVRAAISKNHRTATMFLRTDVAEAMRASKPADATDVDRVFDRMPGLKRYYGHLKAAGIERKDGQGRSIDFHALRHTFITALSRAGIQPRVAMELARHSDMKLTMRTYTDAGLLGTADAVDALPSWETPNPEENRQAMTGTCDTSGTTCRTTFLSAEPCITLHHAATQEKTNNSENALSIGVDNAPSCKVLNCCEAEKTGELGFEPRQTDSESAVLPLHHSPRQNGT